MNVIEKRLDEIKMYDNNPRNNSDAVPAVAKSIRKFGFKQPLVIDKAGVIVAGHTRYLAAKKIGLETVPCVVADDLTPKQINEYRIADNKTSEMARWNYLGLAREINSIDGSDLIDFGFTQYEIDALNGFQNDLNASATGKDKGGKDDVENGVYRPNYAPEFARGGVTGKDIVKAEIEQDVRFTPKDVKTKKCTCPRCGRSF